MNCVSHIFFIDINFIMYYIIQTKIFNAPSSSLPAPENCLSMLLEFPLLYEIVAKIFPEVVKASNTLGW